jgi:hypothetical protein
VRAPGFAEEAGRQSLAEDMIRLSRAILVFLGLAG